MGESKPIEMERVVEVDIRGDGGALLLAVAIAIGCDNLLLFLFIVEK